MKAKEYAARLDGWKDKPAEEVVTICRHILSDFMAETSEIAQKRGVVPGSKTSIEAICSIFDEQDQKWRVMCRRLNGEVFHDGGYISALHADMHPEVWAHYSQHRLSHHLPVDLVTRKSTGEVV